MRSNRQEHDPEEYLSVISELNPPQLIIAREIYRQQQNERSPDENDLQWTTSKGWNGLAEQCGIPDHDMPFHLARVDRTGLIQELTGSYIDYAGGVYVIRPTFRKLMRFVESEWEVACQPN
jgi:hypothetical protein